MTILEPTAPKSEIGQYISTPNRGKQKLPFQFLGYSEDGTAHFINKIGMIASCAPKSLSKTFLIGLADLQWYKDNFSTAEESKAKDPVNWDNVINTLTSLPVMMKQKNIKGIGAWRNDRGEICFHNGNPEQLKGTPDSRWIFLRVPDIEIELDHASASAAVRKEILDVVQSLSFEKWQDAVRVLSWAAIAPFCGCLPWRSACLLTSPTKSGKTTVLNTIIRPLLGESEIYLSGESTEPGVRQKTKADARPVIIDEFGDKNRNELFMLMRSSTSDDTPSIAKGGKDGISSLFQLRCMFLFSGTSGQIEKEEDENRIFIASLKPQSEKGDPHWPKNKAALKRLMTQCNMDGIRSFTWKNLPKIVKYADKLTNLIREVAGVDQRMATVDAPLIAAYILVWLGLTSPSEREVEQIIKDFYRDFEKETVNDTENMLDRLLGHIVTINEGEGQVKYTIRDMLRMLYHGKKLEAIEPDTAIISTIEAALTDTHRELYKRTLHQLGFVIANKYPNAFGMAKNHPQIKRILSTKNNEVGNGYQRQFYSHKAVVDRNLAITVYGHGTAYVVFQGLL